MVKANNKGLNSIELATLRIPTKRKYAARRGNWRRTSTLTNWVSLLIPWLVADHGVMPEKCHTTKIYGADFPKRRIPKPDLFQI